MAIFQIVYVVLYRVRILKSSAKPKTNFEPRTSVVLCLRGEDPSLTHCLEAISQQSYRNFEFIIVVDDMQDPAVSIVNRHFKSQESNNQKHQVVCIEKVNPNCSLKCNAIVTAIRQIDRSTEVIALVDADAVVSQSWLQTLINPLADPSVGCSTGNRWFNIPSSKQLGSSVRSTWNAAAIVQMYLYQIPWGGSLAIRKETIEKLELLEKWSTGFCEDTMLSQLMVENGLVISRPAELVIQNNEAIGLKSSFHWIKRQLLTVRLHHEKWPWVAAHGLATGVPAIGLMLLMLIMVSGWGPSLLLVIFGLVFHQVSNAALLMVINDTHSDLMERSHQRHQKSTLIWQWLSLPMTQTVHFIATLSAIFAKQVSWRQITYSIGKDHLQMVAYQPYQQRERNTESID